MEKKQEVIEEITKDTLLYITLFNRKLSYLRENKTIKTLSWLVLIEQLDNPSISELGKILHLSKSHMTARLDSLAEEGFIERLNDEKDRRIIRIVLTLKGQEFIKNSQKTVKRSMNQLFSPLSIKDVEELKKSVETIKNIVLKIQNSQK